MFSPLKQGLNDDSFKLTILITVLIPLILTGCAGVHPKPPSDYYTSSKSDDTLRVAFDQNGHIFPLSVNEWDWNSEEFKPHWRCKFTGCAFQLKKLTKNGESVYDPVVDRDEYLGEIIGDLNEILVRKDKLAILIHGFNNNYSDAQKIYKEFRSKIDVDVAILEVYWDSLENNVPLKIWFPSLTYSNLAGQIGLRPIINGINKPVDIAFVTHSRGAAVAVSAISNPIYDPKIVAPQEENDSNKDNFQGYTEPNFKNIRSISFAFFAPAIGNGHFWSGINEFLPRNKVAHFYFGTNSKDYATSKSIIPSSKFGDTSLGGDQEEIDAVIKIYSTNNKLISIEQIKFIHGSKHGILGYFSAVNEKKPECMLWAVALKKVKPSCCNISPIN